MAFAAPGPGSDHTCANSVADPGVSLSGRNAGLLVIIAVVLKVLVATDGVEKVHDPPA